MTVYFVGYIEAGKNKWGKKLAKELNYNFVDTRELMQERTGLTYAELLLHKELFIKTEQEIVNEIVTLKNTVVATSELLPCRANNMERLNKAGITFYLRAGLGCIMMRISLLHNDISMLKGIDPDVVPDFIVAELNRRGPFYSQAKINTLGRYLKMPKLLEMLEDFKS